MNDDYIWHTASKMYDMIVESIPKPERKMEYDYIEDCLEYSQTDKVLTICYGQQKLWDNRDEAYRFFTEAFFSSEGSEKERYATILAGIDSGQRVCPDEY